MSDAWKKFSARAARLQKKMKGFEEFKPEDFVVLQRFLDLPDKDRLPFVQDIIREIEERKKTSDKPIYMAEVVLLKYIYEKGLAKGIFNADLNGPIFARYND